MGTDQKSDQEPILSLAGISKQFPGVKALDSVDFSLFAGEVHALLGENGAGKSTLVNIISGLLQPTAGKIRLSAVPGNDRDLPALLCDFESEHFWAMHSCGGEQ
jgi:ABC-type sugar transport system ATPase subunit